MTARLLTASLSLALLVLAGCSATRWENPAPPKQAKAPANKSMAPSKYGNPPFYEVFGVRYAVMDSSKGYREKGIASWYGKKFHGRLTSSRERYDMHRMTAAHKTLPLPTNVRVTNLNNGRSVIVRVNDRGPFVEGRIIDMSYAAALELDMVTAGTVPVEVVALDTSYTGAIASVSASQPAAGAATEKAIAPEEPRMYVQVGAFGEAGNARNLADKLEREGISPVSVREPAGDGDAVYRVRIGPFSDVNEYDRIVAQVETLQIAAPHLVVDDDTQSQPAVSNQ